MTNTTSTTNTPFTQNMDTVFSDLHNFVKTDSILGTPLAVGDKTLVPIMSVTLGYGSADMPKKAGSGASNATSSSNGVGLGAKVSANGVIVIDKNNVSMLNVGENKGSLDQLMDKIPQALGSMGQNITQQAGGQGQQGQGAQNQQSQNQQNK